MQNETQLLAGGMTMLGIATGALVVIPYMTVREVQAPQALKPYTSQQLRGRQQYIANGCIYCHSQQPRAKSFGTDAERGWGRASVAADYAYDSPHLLGTMRTGPDLFNIGARQPSDQWHLGHLYQPRAYMAGSLMPSYPYLFEVKEKADSTDVQVNLPAGYGPAIGVVVAKAEALDLVAYLKALNHTYPVPGVLAPPAPNPSRQ